MRGRMEGPTLVLLSPSLCDFALSFPGGFLLCYSLFLNVYEANSLWFISLLPLFLF